ncbi:hypothetical protein [Actinoplanes sp. NPDC051411]|uniref:hypothetical protein n=1 Tax=Actinoplanes sp. NPDC051411 TaxID=3155522 RepID=UPI003423387E
MATDSQWDRVAEHTRTYLASGGTPRRNCPIYGTTGGADEDPTWFRESPREIPVVLLTPLDQPR